MTKEYGVACLLDNESEEILRKHVYFLEKNNRPHISLFQFNTHDENFLSMLNVYISNIFLSNEFYTDKISLVENNIFLDIKDDSALRAASNQIAEFYHKFCSDKKPPSQINLSELNQSQADLVKKYGIYWIKENYRPHVTLAYETRSKVNFDISLPGVMKLLRPGIYQIDTIGRIEQ